MNLKFSFLPETLSILSEMNIILFPGTTLPLKISDPYYINMIEHCFENECLLGVIQKLPEKQKKTKIGCLGKIFSFSETEQQDYFVLLHGICRFQVAYTSSNEDLNMKHIHVEYHHFLDDLKNQKLENKILAENLKEIFKHYAKIIGYSENTNYIDDWSFDMLVTQLSMSCPFEALEKQALLESKNITQRYEILTSLMEMKIIEGNKMTI